MSLYIRVFLLSLLLLVWWNRPISAQSADLEYEFISDTGVTLEALSAGAQGAGTLVISPALINRAAPRIVIELENNADGAFARIYDNREQTVSKSLNWFDEQDGVNVTRFPAAELHAPAGWWVKEGVTNYNLTITLNGPIDAMWGADNGWLNEMRDDPFQPSVQIQVGDPAGTGHPQWDLRQLIPSYTGQGYYRVNYAESHCPTVAEKEPILVAAWPYVAAQMGDFEQPIGRFHAPILVDWTTGIITHFSELVTVRNQSCSYAMYSLNPLEQARPSRLNFETPFAFYDLSGINNGRPNLILRAEHYAPYDNWSISLNARRQQLRPVPTHFETIRYSWLTEPGRNEWDYKVEVMGTHTYTNTVTIAGGQYRVKSPDYDGFPDWVLARSWPVVTFVDTEDSAHRSDEGIYAYSPRQSGIGHLYSWADVPLDAFDTIESLQLRGEYRYRQSAEVSLYHSPVDQRFHLVGAEGGIWHINETTTQRVVNLDGDAYIDGWVTTRNEQPHEQLYLLGGHLIYAGESEIVLLQTDIPLALEHIKPPSTPETWQQFKQQHEALQRRDPLAMYAWFDTFDGAKTIFTGATLSDIRITDDGFRFVMTHGAQFAMPHNELLGTNTWSGDAAVVNYTDGQFTVEAADPFNQPAPLTASLKAPTTINRHATTPFYITVNNDGQRDLQRVKLTVLVRHALGQRKLLKETVTLLAGSQQRHLVTWQPVVADDWQVIVQMHDTDDTLLLEEATPIRVNDAVESVEPTTAPQVRGALLSSATIGLFALLLVSVRTLNE